MRRDEREANGSCREFTSSHSHRQFLEIKFIWKLASVINYVFVFFLGGGRHLSVNILMTVANKIRRPNVNRTNHRVTMMVTRQAVTLWHVRVTKEALQLGCTCRCQQY